VLARTANHRKLVVRRAAGLVKGDEALVRVTGVKGTTFLADLVGVTWKCDRVAA
jgi:hypothetical protein